MIKFFRKIRQNLLIKNKFSKYLLYAIGEIVLVVIGILIALGINNRNQERINEDKITSILKEIQNDLKNIIVFDVWGNNISEIAPEFLAKINQTNAINLYLDDQLLSKSIIDYSAYFFNPL